MLFNADATKIQVHKMLLTETGAQGGMTICDSPDDDLAEFAGQICNERLVQATVSKYDGKTRCVWKTMEPHDFGDTLSQALAASQQAGISSTIPQQTKTNGELERKRRLVRRLRARRKVIVR